MNLKGMQSPMGKVWILEDDDQMCRILKSLLQAYSCTFLKTIENFSNEWKKTANRPDLLLADITLPDGSFLEWMKANQNFHQSSTRCMVISGLQDIESMRSCLALGAFDYIVKPFVPAEVEIKVERILISHQLPLKLNSATHTVAIHNQSIILTSKQFQIIALLQAAYPRGLNKEELQQAVWQDTKVNEKNLTVHLSLLRTKLKEIGLNINFQKSAYFLELT